MSQQKQSSRRLSFKTSLINLTDKFRFSKFKPTKSVPQSLSFESSLSTTAPPQQQSLQNVPIPIHFQIAKTRQACFVNETNEPLYSSIISKQNTANSTSQSTAPNKNDRASCIVVNNDRRYFQKLVISAPRPNPHSITLFPSQVPEPNDILIDFDNQPKKTVTSESSSSSSSPSLLPYDHQSTMMPTKASLKEHFCFYCSQYCSSLNMCKCSSCIIRPIDMHQWRHSSVLKPVVVKPSVSSSVDRFRIKVQPKQRLNEFEFRPICEPGESVPLYEEIKAEDLHKTKHYHYDQKIKNCSVLKRRDSSDIQCSLQCLASPFKRFTDNEKENQLAPSSSVQTRPQSAAKRRQRNLTTSLTTSTSTTTTASQPIQTPQDQPNLCIRRHRFKNSNIISFYRDEQLEQFLDSLEDISSYLDRKIALTEESENTRKEIVDLDKKQVVTSNNGRAVYRRTRNLTQPIFFKNDLLKMTEKSKDTSLDDSAVLNKEETLTNKLKATRRSTDHSGSLKFESMENLIPLCLDASKISLHVTEPVDQSAPISAFRQHRPKMNENAKPFVSLSDILKSQQNSSTSEHLSQNNLYYYSKKRPTTIKTIACPPASLVCPDFLTVQALFKELELDCDEQIKLLDETERQRKDAFSKQKKILDSVKCQWMGSKPQARRILKKKNTKMLKKPAKRVKVFQFSPATRLLTVGVLRRSHFDKKLCMLILVSTVEPNRAFFASIPVCRIQIFKQKFSIDKASLQFQFSSLNSTSIEAIRRLQTQAASLRRIKVNVAGKKALFKSKQNNMLDKDCGKYSGQVQLRHPNRHTSKLDRLNKELKIQYNRRQTNLMIENYETGKAQVFNELIEACKWLIDAGYAQTVHEILKTDKPAGVDKSNPKNRPSLDTIRACNGLQDLQQCEFNSIYRRLEVLYAATDFFNVDYKYFKENCLNLNDDEDADLRLEDFSEDDLDSEDEENLTTNNQSKQHERIQKLPQPLSIASKLNQTNMQPQPHSSPVLTSAKLFKCIQFSLDSQLHPFEQTRSKAPTANINRFNSFRRPNKSPNRDNRPTSNNSLLYKWSSNLDIPTSSVKPIITFPIDSKKTNKINSKACSSSSNTSTDSSSYQLLTSLEDQLPKISLLQLTESIPAIDIELNVVKSSSDDFANQAVPGVNHQDVALVGPRRERCDSGVGGSLSREPVSRRREKWTSFRMSHQHAQQNIGFGSAPGKNSNSSQLFISGLSAKQFAKLKKFALLRLTALLEKHGHHSQQASSVKFNWNKFKPKFLRHKSPKQTEEPSNAAYKHKSVFGVPLRVNFQRHGRALPQAIIQLMKYVRTHSTTTVGIFRKSGSKLRMAQLREIVERQPAAYFDDFEKLLSSAYVTTNSSSSNSPLPHHLELNSIGSGFSSQSDLAGNGDDSSVRSSVESSKEASRERSIVQTVGQNAETMAIDVADVLKQYFRELPECLCTNKLSQMLIDIFTYLPVSERLEAVQYCMLLLDDENRDVLQCLLYFLYDISKNSHVHKMDSRNIAICLAPTLLNMTTLKESSPNQSYSHFQSPHDSSLSQSSTQSTLPNTAQLMSRQCNASLDCLSFMIDAHKLIFQVPTEAYTKCQFTRSDHATPLSLTQHLGSFSHSLLHIYFNDRIDRSLAHLRDKARNWTRLRLPDTTSNDKLNISIAYKVLEDEDFPLRLWKASIDLEASVESVLTKLLRGRVHWDEDLVESRVLEVLESQTEVFQYVVHVMAPQPSREFVELRGWRDAGEGKRGFVIYSSSIEHEKASEVGLDRKVAGDVRANCLVNFYLIEQGTEPDTCRLQQIYRADYRGYSAEWYNRVQGHLLRQHLLNLSDCVHK